MAKRPIIELPIHTYTPTDPTRKSIAYIGNLPIRFKGETVEQAYANADAWRHEEVAKLKKAHADKAARAVAMTAGRQTKEATHA